MERWLPVPDWPTYEVSDQGRVRSLDRVVRYADGRVRRYPGQLIKATVSPYPAVRLSAGTRSWQACVHQLVTLAFIGPPPEGQEVRHLNGIKTDVRLVNLAFGTRSENNHDRVRHGADHNAAKDRCPQGHRYDAENTRVYERRDRPGVTFRRCLKCNRASAKRSYQRRKQAA